MIKRSTTLLCAFSLAVTYVFFLMEPVDAESAQRMGKGISKAGRILPASLNTILSGTGAPAASLGDDGDFYIDRYSWEFYGPKVKGYWSLPVQLAGPAGMGLPGNSADATSSAGSSGPRGLASQFVNISKFHSGGRCAKHGDNLTCVWRFGIKWQLPIHPDVPQ